MDRTQERKREIDAAVADIRAIEQRDGITRSSLAKIRQRLIQLAARTDLLAARDFPPPDPAASASPASTASPRTPTTATRSMPIPRWAGTIPPRTTTRPGR